MRQPLKIREVLYTLSTIAIAASVANLVGCGGSSCDGNMNSETSNQHMCLSNMKQIGLATAQYLQDYDEQFPPPVHGAPIGWAGKIYPYIKSTAVMTCPDDKTSPGTGLSPSPVAVSYAFNSNAQNFAPSAGPMSEAEIVQPSLSVAYFEISGDPTQASLAYEGSNDDTAPPPTGYRSACGDGLGLGPEYGYLGAGASTLRYATGQMGGRTQITTGPRHSGGSNYLALDFHAIWLSPDKISSGTENPSATGVQDNPAGASAAPGVGTYSLTFSIK